MSLLLIRLTLVLSLGADLAENITKLIPINTSFGKLILLPKKKQIRNRGISRGRLSSVVIPRVADGNEVARFIVQEEQAARAVKLNLARSPQVFKGRGAQMLLA